MKFHVKTYGCQMNVRDTEAVEALLVRHGHERAEGEADARLVLVNTCSVRGKAEAKALGKLGLLVAGKNNVATDAVATALMGHDPTGEYPDTPYVRCDNHLNIARSLGMGTNRLEEIEVLGGRIEDLQAKFVPAP